LQHKEADLIHESVQTLGREYPSLANPELVSEWEKILYTALYDVGIKTIPQYSIEKYLLDLAFIKGKRCLDIEVDGEKYHRNWNGEYCYRDQLRNQRMYELGWDVLRFWVFEVRDDLDHCIERVKDWIEKNKDKESDSTSIITDDVQLPKSGSDKQLQPKKLENNKSEFSSGEYAQRILTVFFDGRFKVHKNYQFLFESDMQMVYFQNFNKKDTENLWYRISQSALRLLKTSIKDTYVCLTNPSLGLLYMLPMQEVEKRIEKAGWVRDDLEVNIIVKNSYWRELNWDLSHYKKRVYQ